MSTSVISAEGLGKAYNILRARGNAPYRSLRDEVAETAQHWLRAFGPSRAQPGQNEQGAEVEYWALRDVNFDVEEGEVLGIIGRNGAGKSTLLKILSRITDPTAGRVTIKGRVSSLLEVGTGFHPELTGRENIYLNGSILGMTRAEIRSNFESIVAFAEVERFLDTPVKRYSSGMYVRLAFAVAAHLESEILILDEVLAVGDADFQNKCFGKISSVARSGRTILLVSHNASTIRSLCSRCVVLNQGSVAYDGDTATALGVYLQRPAPKLDAIASQIPASPISILRLEVDEVKALEGEIELTVEFSSKIPLDPPLVGAVFHNRFGLPVFGVNTQTNSSTVPGSTQHAIATLKLGKVPLLSELYSVSVYLGRRGENLLEVKSAISFELISDQSLPPGLSPEVVGSCYVAGSWAVCDIAIKD